MDYKQKYEMLKKQQRGGYLASYIMDDSMVENPSEFKNADLLDTVTGDITKKIFDNEFDDELNQNKVNKFLVTAILTLNNKINNLQAELSPILNPKLYEVIFSEEKKEEA